MLHLPRKTLASSMDSSCCFTSLASAAQACLWWLRKHENPLGLSRWRALTASISLGSNIPTNEGTRSVVSEGSFGRLALRLATWSLRLGVRHDS